jgi:CheY-like chemotaxis protein
VDKGRILIVDDEPSLLSGLSELFEQEYDVFTSASAEGALPILERERIEVVLSDFKMPGMDGLSFLIEVRRRRPEVVRILMTAYADMQLVIRAMNEGEVHRFIAKPFKTAELRTMLRECAGLARLNERGTQQGGKRTVLVAHDSLVSQTVLRMLLAPAYQVLTTGNGCEAMNIIARQQVDAVVLGVGLELLDGCTIATYLKKEQRAATPVVFWASDVAGPYREYLAECGADLTLDQADPDSLASLQKFLRTKLQ